jgi:thiamine pyrophosphokinase
MMPSPAEGIFMDDDVFAVIVANGELTVSETLRSLLGSADFIVAADGGLEHILRLGYTPHLIIGDMDSVEQEDLTKMKTRGIEVIIHPREKDETDLELALDAVLQRGYRSIRILAGLGGRLDQTLGNVYLLAQPELAGQDVRFIDEKQEVFAIREEGTVRGKVGDTVSLIPLGNAVKGIHTQGLKYRLKGETLFPYHTRGISNVMTETRALIHIQEGILLCIHMHS